MRAQLIQKGPGYFVYPGLWRILLSFVLFFQTYLAYLLTGKEYKEVACYLNKGSHVVNVYCRFVHRCLIAYVVACPFLCSLVLLS